MRISPAAARLDEIASRSKYGRVRYGLREVEWNPLRSWWISPRCCVGLLVDVECVWLAARETSMCTMSPRRPAFVKF